MRLAGAADVAAACSGDALVLWGAQGMGPGVRAWALGESVAVACPDLNRRDRLTVRGLPAQVGVLAEHALREVGPSYRLVGERALVEEVAARSAGSDGPARLELLGSFEWMDTPPGAPPPAPARPSGREGAAGPAGWLPGAQEGEVSALLARAAPSAWAVPGVAGVRRWAGVRGDDGQLVAVAADAWSCPAVGFAAGVATAPAVRGRGYGERVCRFVFAELAAAHERVALMVDTGNHAAIALYERLGLRGRPLAAAALNGT
ncbi:GNAT family N-acetyltransferase [Streptosporangium sp. NPDC048865]|uniref:GNAT family N-acetyltransferase n=1 Tax=Streptosporangium sp. NPDC048865 TaxID=3155766 RepID=UPI003431D809